MEGKGSKLSELIMHYNCSRKAPEVNLWVHVLLRAIHDALFYDYSDYRSRSARVWLYSRSVEMGSLEWVCDVVGLGDPNRIRHFVESYDEHQRFYDPKVVKAKSRVVKHRESK